MSNPGPYRYKTKVVISSVDASERNSYYDVEGGALNSGYKDFDVGCIVSNDLGLKGWTYGKDFYFPYRNNFIKIKSFALTKPI